MLKIADFGLSRRSDADYVYVSFRNAQGLLPFRWMAPECFESDGGTVSVVILRKTAFVEKSKCVLVNQEPVQTYSEKSDVWAFGVTLWEIFTRSRPFNGMSQTDVRSHIEAGKRLEDPRMCPKEVQVIAGIRPLCFSTSFRRDLLHRCWAQNPRQRPTFSQIKEDIAEIDRRCGGDAEYTRQEYEVVTFL